MWMFEAIVALKDDEGSLQEVPLSCSIAQGTISNGQVGERDGDLPVLRAVLTLLDGEGPLLEVPLPRCISKSAVSVT